MFGERGGDFFRGGKKIRRPRTSALEENGDDRYDGEGGGGPDPVRKNVSWPGKTLWKKRTEEHPNWPAKKKPPRLGEGGKRGNGNDFKF